MINGYETKTNPLPSFGSGFVFPKEFISCKYPVPIIYLTITNLLAPLGAKGSGDLVMQVFTSAMGNLQNKINQQIFSEESETALKELYSDVSDLASKSK